jgi:plastocyanin
MTWLWRIFFSGAFSGLALLPLWGAALTGGVALEDSRNPAVRRHKDFSGVVLWLEPAAGANSAPTAVSSRHAQMIQRDKHFIPHVLAIQVGTAVDFPNLDPIFHSAFSTYSGQTFDLALYPPNTSRTELFKRPGIVRVFCNIHPTMSAVIAVLDSPWFAVSRASGVYQIRGVPPGDYQLHIFHERATDETLRALTRPVTVGDAPLTLSPIAISETGYLPGPHKNKYGKDYPPVIDSQPAYPARP